MRAWKADGAKVPVKAWVDGVPLDDGAKEQLEATSRLPFIHHHVAAMPDVHWGIGATVGSVIPTKGAIVPAAVGVDIGCGMVAMRTEVRAEQLPDSLAEVRSAIEAVVPVGFGDHGDRVPAGSEGKWALDLAHDYEFLIEDHVKPGRKSPLQQLGTLGGGNHFIELCLDESDRLWLMLHSGSRGIGNRIGQHFIGVARRECERWGVNLPQRDLAYLPEGTEHFDDYVEAVGWAQDYARINRECMVRQIVQRLSGTLLPSFGSGLFAVNCHHNYVEKEHHFGASVWVTRKGAVRAREGDLGIIPGSMGARSYIVRGKGNADSFHSCSHGAGRVMSRKEAKRKFTVEDHQKATVGVECRKDEGVLDETPGAYKNIDAVMAAQADLVEIIHTLRQVVCVKG